jgi:DNA (cytosine-5)-methyltransferase 1
MALCSGGDTLNAISVCTGGGGLDLGLELAIPSLRPVCMVEREAFAAERLGAAMEAGLLAPCPIWTDARTFRGREWRGLVDGVFGGIPCQGNSEAGRRLGAADERDLWPAFRRTVVQSGAWWFVLENVGGILSPTAEGGEPAALRIARELQRMGWRYEAGLFAALEVGDTQERERWFVLACADGERAQEWRGQRGHAQQKREAIARVRCVDLVGADGRGRDGRPEGPQRGEVGRIVAERPGGSTLFPPGPDEVEAWWDTLQLWPAVEPALCRMADGLADRVERVRMLGNGVVPLQAAYAIRTLAHRLASRGSAGARELVLRMAA